MSSELVVPGQVLGSVSTHLAGPGTHVHEQDICASIVGTVVTTQPSSATGGGKPTISIPRQSKNLPLTRLPTVGSTVICRVIRVQQRQVIASILVTDPTPTAYVPLSTITNDELQFQAVLRREDIRGYEKDRVVVNDMFRTGDIVRAVVISLGDERSYYVSTIGNEYGVVLAQSEAGNAMVPASWNSMVDAVSGRVEPRKVAKPSSSS